MDIERRVPASRLGRLTQIGRLAGGVAGGALVEGARALSRGRRPAVSELLLTPTNAARLANRLAEMRGAAMKLGQLVSMESDELVPPVLSEALARLREQAYRMPLGQVAQVLETAWGSGWQAGFRRFSFAPLAAASIGQVHRAELKAGPVLAVKLQYPGVRRSIDSDVDMVATLLRLLDPQPGALDLDALLAEAKTQLHAEADYLQEAALLRRFRAHLAGDPRFEVPEVFDELTTAEVLAMGFLDGIPLEHLTDAESRLRNRVGTDLLDLGLREVLDWGLVQSDPNLANYRWQADHKRIQLLDFGATRDFQPRLRRPFADLLRAGTDGDETDLARAAAAVGYLDESDPPAYRQTMLRMLHAATEPARFDGDFPFGGSDLARRVSEMAIRLRVEERFARLPPPEILFIHRKLGGLYLILSRLRARVPVRRLLRERLD